MNGICVSLAINDCCNINNFRSCSNKIFTDISNLEEIKLKLGYTLNIVFISSTYITIQFKSLNTEVSFNPEFNTLITYNLPVEGGSYCVRILLTKNCCATSCCNGG